MFTKEKNTQTSTDLSFILPLLPPLMFLLVLFLSYFSVTALLSPPPSLDRSPTSNNNDQVQTHLFLHFMGMPLNYYSYHSSLLLN